MFADCQTSVSCQRFFTFAAVSDCCLVTSASGRYETILSKVKSDVRYSANASPTTLLPVSCLCSRDSHRRSSHLFPNSMTSCSTPSIQQFFPVVTPSSLPHTPSPRHGDGFTAEEIDAALHTTLLDNWTPPSDYEQYDIGALCPGPKRVTVSGRIVNLFRQRPGHRTPRNAKGCLKVLIRDDTGILTVRCHVLHIDTVEKG